MLFTRPAAPLALLLACIRIAGCAASGEIPVYPDSPRSVAGPSSMIFVGDTQGPIWFETLRLAADDNERVPWAIFRAIARDASCAAVFHLGDLTALGSYATYWETFDEDAEPLRSAGIPLYPAAGNHEYMPFAWAGREHLVRRFPVLAASWYEQRIGSVAVLVLNSNFHHLSTKEGDAQRRWYEKTLQALDADSAVTVVIVTCHHPPYTNSTIVGPDEEVQRSFVPAYVRSKKALAFISGHAHTFEHFRIDGKDFIVSGGGGGLLHPLLRGSDARWPDRYTHERERSFFHYLRLVPLPGDPGGRRLTLDVIRLSVQPGTWDTAYHVDLP